MVADVNHRGLDGEKGVGVVPAEQLLFPSLDQLAGVAGGDGAQVNVFLPFYVVFHQ